MAVFAFIAENNQIIDDYMLSVKKKLSSNSLIKNPFIGGIKDMVINTKNGEIKVMYIVKMTPIYFNFTQYIWLFAFGSYIIFGFNAVTWIMVALACLGIFWSKWFFYGMFKLGLHKKGINYKSTKLISTNDVLEYIIWDNKKY